MSFTLRRTGFENPDDYVFKFNGVDVGRCYRGSFGMHGDGWRWSIYGTNLTGIEDSLEAAQEKFKAVYLARRGSG